MFNINWASLISSNTPAEWRHPLTFSWLKLLVSELKKNHAAFLLYRQQSLVKVGFTGQIIYLEHVLNDTFDDINRGVYIDNVADLNRIYFFNKVEQRDPLYLYNNHDAAVSYLEGEYSVEGDIVYKALSDNTNTLPSANPLDWKFDKKVTYFKNAIEYSSQYDFVVMVPVAVAFDVNRMKALVNYYRVAGKRFDIKTY